jgi:hypothetical protein
MKVSKAIELLNEVLDTAGDVEIKIDTGEYFTVCREMYLNIKEYRTNQFVVFSKNELDWRKNRANNFRLGDYHKQTHPKNRKK